MQYAEITSISYPLGAVLQFTFLLFLINFWKSSSLRKKKLEFGPWCVVTGATDGIGKEYARQLAATGGNIVLISRSLQKLGQLSLQLSQEFKVQVRTIQADFSQGAEIYGKIALGLEGLEIGTLVNNVGMTYSKPCYFHELGAQEGFHILNCNILSTITMTRMVLPGMLRREKGGIIINVSSLASEVSFPFLSLYSASKAFADKFSQDIAAEYGSSGITIQSLVPACVATRMSHIEHPSFFAPTPQKFVQSAISSLVREGGSTRTTGYFAHQLQLVWFRFLKIVFPSLFQKWNIFVMNRWRVISSIQVDGLEDYLPAV